MNTQINSAINNKRVVVAIILLFIILIYLAFTPKLHKNESSQEVHYHVGFVIYENNKLLDFRAPEFMHLDPCGNEEQVENDLSSERVHLHNNIGDIAHVHNNRATWGDLLDSLNYRPPSRLTFYLNGKLVVNSTALTIAPNDRMLILVGDFDNQQEKFATVPDEHAIRAAEAEVENC